jgi:hypothetical protein
VAQRDVLGLPLKFRYKAALESAASGGTFNQYVHALGKRRLTLPATCVKEVAAVTLLRQGADVALTCEFVDENRLYDRDIEHKQRWEIYKKVSFPRPPDKQAVGSHVRKMT